MKRYLIILSVALIGLLAFSATSFGRYDPLVNSLGLEPEGDEHPWGGEEQYIDVGGDDINGTDGAGATQFFIFDLITYYNVIIIFHGGEDTDNQESELIGSSGPTTIDSDQNESGFNGKGN